MGWWEAGDEGDIIGDDPADRLTSALRNLVSSRQQRALPPKPTLSEFLASMREALRRYNYSATDVGEPPRYDVGAVLTPGDNVVYSDRQGNEDDIRVLTEAFDAVAADYRDVLERAPSVRELVATVSFVLTTEQHRLLADLDAISIGKLVLSP